MESTEVWYKLYDKGFNNGIDGLNDKQVLLYQYIDLFYSLEMGGVSGFLYNKLNDVNLFDKCILTLQYYALHDICDDLKFIYLNFKKVDDGREETWEEFLYRTGVNAHIEKLESQILNIVSEKYVQEWIKDNFAELIENLD